MRLSRGRAPGTGRSRRGAPARAASRSVDLVVRNGTVVTVDAERRVIADGALAIDRGAIVAVGPRAEVAKAFVGRRVLDAGGGIVLPGLVNTHTHAPMVLFRGIADDLKLMDWLPAASSSRRRRRT